LRAATEFVVDALPVPLYVSDYAPVGPADDPPVLLLHGLLTSGQAWKSVIASLPSSRRVIVPDLRGHGRSAAASNDVCLDELTDDLFGVLDALDVSRATLVGLSLGGLVCLRAAVRHPQRVTALALVATPASPETVESGARRLATLEAMDRLGKRGVLRGMASWLFGGTTRRHSPEVVEAWLESLESVDPIAIRRTAQAALRRSDARPWLGRVHVPALVVAGAQDAVVSADDVAALAGGLPLGQLCELPDAGHLVPLERPETLGRALEGWMAAADGRSSPVAGGADARTSA
jgi:3-oxoadipate enol-lactonase